MSNKQDKALSDPHGGNDGGLDPLAWARKQALALQLPTDIAEAVEYAVERGWPDKPMMTRREVLLMIAHCVNDKTDAYLNAQAMAFANVLGAHDQWEIGLQDEVAEAVEAERREREAKA